MTLAAYLILTLPLSRVKGSNPRALYSKAFGMTRGPFLTSPLAPRGEICPLGVKFPGSFPPGVNDLYCLEEWSGKQRISPPGDNFTPGPRGEFKNGRRAVR
jgi:hypothetical protein